MQNTKFLAFTAALFSGVFLASVALGEPALVLGEPIITNVNDSELIRPRPGKLDGYEQSVYLVSDGSATFYFISDSERPDENPFPEYTVSYTFTSPPQTLLPGETFNFFMDGEVSGAGYGRDLGIRASTPGFGVKENNYAGFDLPLDVGDMTLVDRSVGRNIYSGTGNARVDYTIEVRDDLPDEAAIIVTIEGGRSGLDVRITYPYTLQEESGLITRDDGAMGGAETCNVVTQETIDQAKLQVQTIQKQNAKIQLELDALDQMYYDFELFYMVENGEIVIMTEDALKRSMQPLASVIAWERIFGDDVLFPDGYPWDGMTHWSADVATVMVDTGLTLDEVIPYVPHRSPAAERLLLAHIDDARERLANGERLVEYLAVIQWRLKEAMGKQETNCG